MSSYTGTIAYNPFENSYGTKGTFEPEHKAEIIEIDDLNETETITSINIISNSTFLTFSGIIPSNIVFTNVKEKLLLATLLTAIQSLLNINYYNLQIFVILNIFFLISELIFNKDKNYREKISYFVANYLLVTLSGIAELFVGTINISYTPIKISPFFICIWFLNISFLYCVFNRLVPFTVLFQNHTIKAHTIAVKLAFEKYKCVLKSELKKGNKI
jgi:hypothetical protein